MTATAGSIPRPPAAFVDRRFLSTMVWFLLKLVCNPSNAYHHRLSRDALEGSKTVAVAVTMAVHAVSECGYGKKPAFFSHASSPPPARIALTTVSDGFLSRDPLLSRSSDVVSRVTRL